jgi:hypothetical protein
MGLEGKQQSQLRGDASVVKKDAKDKKVTEVKKMKPQSTVEPKRVVSKKNAPIPIKETESTDDAWGNDEDKVTNKSSLDTVESLKETLPKTDAPTSAPTKSSYVPPHLRGKSGVGATAPAGSYVPPHLRNRQ